jgi:hypothetical protein
VGEELTTGLLKVTCREHYYADDYATCICALEEMCEGMKKLELNVVLGDSFSHVRSEPLHSEVSTTLPLPLISKGQTYVLDICLDYFYCKNPFLLDVQRNWGGQLAIALHNIAVSADFRNSSEPVDRSVVDSFNDNLRSILCSFQRGEQIDEDTSGSNTAEKNAVIAAFNALRTASERSKAAEKVLEILDVLVLPDSEFGSSCLEGRSANFRWDRELEAAKLESMLLTMTSKQLPTAITIARSTVDEFCPSDICDECEQMCLDVLQRIWPDDSLLIYYAYKNKDDDSNL